MHVSVCVSVFNVCFPNYYHVPIDVTAEWAASLVYTRSPFIQLGGLEHAMCHDWTNLQPFN